MSIKRKTIIETIVETLKPLDFVYALWEGGAVSFNRLDRWSDIDIMVVCEDDAIDKVFKNTEKMLKKISDMEVIYEVPKSASQGFYQKFYKLKDADEFMLIDFAVAKLSKPDKFLQKEIHGIPMVYFDKKKITVVPPINRKTFNKQKKARLNVLKTKFDLFNIFFLKEINRKNYVEAVEFYNAFMLGSLVTVLRMKYAPFHYDFRAKYIYYDLPKRITKKLEKLYFIKDKNDLTRKYKIIKNWFYSVEKEL